LHVELLALGVLKKILVQEVELGRGQLAVLFPPDGLFGVLVADDELVLGAATRVDAGFGAQGAALDQVGLAVCKRVLVKRRLGQVPIAARSANPNCSAPQARLRKPVSFTAALPQKCFGHCSQCLASPS
jgi:hypothetical protein